MTLKQTDSNVLIEESFSKKFAVSRRLRQGDPLSTILFNLVLELIVRKSKIQKTGLIYQHKEQCIAYATVLMTRSKKELENIFQKLMEKVTEYNKYVIFNHVEKNIRSKE